jgi:hypothetical protein
MRRKVHVISVTHYDERPFAFITPILQIRLHQREIARQAGDFSLMRGSP